MTVTYLPYEELAEYLGQSHSYTQEQVEEAIEAETHAQLASCRDVASPALTSALKRRVLRHLEMRNAPLGVVSDGDFGSVRLGSLDPEVRRLEAPFRKLVVG